MTSLRKAIAWSGHRVREARIHWDRWRLPAHPLRVLIQPGGGSSGQASDLRGVALGHNLRRRGIRALCLPGQLELNQRRRIFRVEKPHVVIHQKVRHPHHRPWFFPGVLNVLDLDDADFVDPRLHDEMVAVARHCDAAVAGSRYIQRWLERYCPHVEVIWTGSPLVTHVPASRPSQRRPIVGWAVSDVMGYRNEAEYVREVVLAAADRATFGFRVQGQGDARRIRQFFQPLSDAGIAVEYVGFQPYRRFVRGLESLAVGLAPLVIQGETFAAGKSFGKVLGYLAADVPIIASNNVDHPLFFRDGENGYLADTVETWSHRIVELIQNPALRDNIVSAARIDFKARLSIDAAGAAWADLLHRLTAAPAGDTPPPPASRAA